MGARVGATPTDGRPPDTMRLQGRLLRGVAVLDVVVLTISLLAAATHDARSGAGSDAGVEEAESSPYRSTPPSASSSTTEPNDPPPIELSPTVLATAATATAERPAAFEMTVEFRHRSWLEDGVPGTATLHGVVDGDRLRYEFPGHNFVGADRTGLTGVAPAPVVSRAWRAAVANSAPLMITVIGPQLFECGRLEGDGRCEVFHDVPALVDRYWPNLVVDLGVLLQIPTAHLLTLGGVTHSETIGRTEIRGVDVQHASGTFTMGAAIRSQTVERQRGLRLWFGSLLNGIGAEELLGDEEFTFEAWVDDGGLIRRVSMTMLASPPIYLESGATSALSFMEANPDAPTLTVTLDLFDFDQHYDFPVPVNAEPFIPDDGVEDPSVTAPIDAQDAAEKFEQMFGNS